MIYDSNLLDPSVPGQLPGILLACPYPSLDLPPAILTLGISIDQQPYSTTRWHETTTRAAQ